MIENKTNTTTNSTPARGLASSPPPPGLLAHRMECLTLTGVDESVPISALYEISRHFPFAEFGVLYSNTQSGQGRYPSPKWIKELARQLTVSPNIRVALHVCGSAVGDLLNGHGQVTEVVRAFGRVQLNFAENKYPVDALHKLLQSMPRTIFITQSRYPNDQGNLWRALADMPNHAVLFDASGGNGITPARWPEPQGTELKMGQMLGYAGGLDGDNIAQHLKTIARITKKEHFWLDMQTGLRVNDEFDLRVALKCLATVSSIIKQSDERLQASESRLACCVHA